MARPAHTLLRLLLAVTALTVAIPAARAFDADRFAAIVEQGRRDWQVPGIAVAVIENGRTVFLRGFGQSGEHDADVDEHTLFANASTTKAMLAAGILLLADDGRLDLDDALIDHLPEVHFHADLLTAQVTIRDLLAHRTGLPGTDFWTFRQLTPLAEQLRRLRLVEPKAAPRSRLIYQNTMYELAGLVIRRVSGSRWDEFLRERLWLPIGMHSTYGTRGQIPAGKLRVLPHAIVDGKVRPIPFDLLADQEDAAGSAWSSVHDMSLWAGFLLRGGITADGTRLLSEAAMRDMFEPQQLVSEDDYYPTHELTRPAWRSYSLGWYQQDFQGRKIDLHTGSLDGLVAIVGLDHADQRAVVVLQNLDGSELRHALLWEVMDQSVADRRDWNAEVRALYAAREAERQAKWQALEQDRLARTRPSLPLAAYLGRYTNEVLGDIVFTRQGDVGSAKPPVAARATRAADALVLRTGMYEYEVSHWHLDTFLVDYVAWKRGTFARFRVDERGRVAALEVFEHVFERHLPDAEAAEPGL